MDSDEGYNYEFDEEEEEEEEEEECSEDSGEEEAEDDTLDLGEVELLDPAVAGGEPDDCVDTGGGGGLCPGQEDEDYRFEVLTTEQILQHMVECIREVNEVIQVHSKRFCCDFSNEFISLFIWMTDAVLALALANN